MKELESIPGVGEARAKALRDVGFETVDDVVDAGPEDLVEAEGIGSATADTILTNARGGDVDVGRPTKLTMQRQESIAQMLEDSHSVRAACRCNGISHNTFYEWLEKGDQQDEGVYADFADRVARARGAGERQLVDDLLDTAREKGDTRTMLSVLKSRYPESWGDAETDEEGADVNVYLTADKKQ